MDSAKQRIHDKVREAFLPTEDAALWDQAVDLLPPETQEAVWHFITTTPDGLEFLTQNLKAKYSALETVDPKQWEAIMQSEKTYIKSLNPSLTV